MELRPGYKQTAAGVIPEDWEVLPLSDTCSRIQDGTHFSPSPGGSEYLYITSKNIRFGYLDLSSASLIGKRQHDAIYRRCDVKRGDLLLTKDGANTGNAAVNTLDEEFSLLSSVAFLRFDSKKHFTSYFLQQILSSQGQSQIQETMSGNAITRLTLAKINRLCFPVPGALAEEKRIGDALSDADALIDSLEQLLAKKRQIKQGAMQELLTGKNRLQEFRSTASPQRTDFGIIPSDWIPSTIGDISIKVGSGITPKGGNTNYHESGRPFIRSQNIGWGDLLLDDMVFIDEVTHSSFESTEIQKDDVLLNITGASIGRCAVADDLVTGGNVNQHVCIIRTDSKRVDAIFISYLLLSRVGQGQIDSFQAGGNRQGLNFGQIRSIQIPLPSMEAEQIAIAGVLFDMDAEIARLDTKLSKTRQLKQGMMQELLTGRIRLVRPSTEILSFPAKENASAANVPHNTQINEAVVIAVLSAKFGSDKFPLGRFRRTKFSYLLHRHVEHEAAGFIKKAAGPYNPRTRYGGAEKIALQNRYVRILHTERGEGFVADENIAQAEGYFEKWYGAEALTWLEQFRYQKNDALELLTTVDMACGDLSRADKAVTLSAVKQIIHDSPEWKAKLDRSVFSDDHIAATIQSCRQLFPVEEE